MVRDNSNNEDKMKCLQNTKDKNKKYKIYIYLKLTYFIIYLHFNIKEKHI